MQTRAQVYSQRRPRQGSSPQRLQLAQLTHSQPGCGTAAQPHSRTQTSAARNMTRKKRKHRQRSQRFLDCHRTQSLSLSLQLRASIKHPQRHATHRERQRSLPGPTGPVKKQAAGLFTAGPGCKHTRRQRRHYQRLLRVNAMQVRQGVLRRNRGLGACIQAKPSRRRKRQSSQRRGGAAASVWVARAQDSASNACRASALPTRAHTPSVGVGVAKEGQVGALVDASLAVSGHG